MDLSSQSWPIHPAAPNKDTVTFVQGARAGGQLRCLQTAPQRERPGAPTGESSGHLTVPTTGPALLSAGLHPPPPGEWGGDGSENSPGASNKAKAAAGSSPGWLRTRARPGKVNKVLHSKACTDDIVMSHHRWPHSRVRDQVGNTREALRGICDRDT